MSLTHCYCTCFVLYVNFLTNAIGLRNEFSGTSTSSLSSSLNWSSPTPMPIPENLFLKTKVLCHVNLEPSTITD